MEITNDKSRQEQKQTYGQIAEGVFFADVRDLLQAWREAGKPHKR